MIRKRRDVETGQMRHDKHEHDRAENDRYVMSRAEDRSFWFRSSYLMEKYMIIWVPVLWLVTALGFGVITPNVRFAAVAARIDTTRNDLQSEIDTLKRQAASEGAAQSSIRVDVDALVKFDCLDPRITARDKELAGLHCP